MKVHSPRNAQTWTTWRRKRQQCDQGGPLGSNGPQWHGRWPPQEAEPFPGWLSGGWVPRAAQTSGSEPAEGGRGSHVCMRTWAPWPRGWSPRDPMAVPFLLMGHWGRRLQPGVQVGEESRDIPQEGHLTPLDVWAPPAVTGVEWASVYHSLVRVLARGGGRSLMDRLPPPGHRQGKGQDSAPIRKWA